MGRTRDSAHRITFWAFSLPSCLPLAPHFPSILSYMVKDAVHHARTEEITDRLWQPAPPCLHSSVLLFFSSFTEKFERKHGKLLSPSCTVRRPSPRFLPIKDNYFQHLSYRRRPETSRRPHPTLISGTFSDNKLAPERIGEKPQVLTLGDSN